MTNSQTAGSLLRHVRALNHWKRENFTPWRIGKTQVGYLKPFMLEALSQWPEWFSISDREVIFKPGAAPLDERSRILECVVHSLVKQSVIRQHIDETYPVTGSGGRGDLLATLDRGAAGYFGIKTYGQHLNGYVITANGIKVWVARRDATRVHFPGKLDNVVAGGLPQNLGFEENLLKECREEADIPAELARKAIPVGAISYCRETDIGLKPDTLYCYDLELPAEFTPVNTDGEVAEFMLMTAADALELVRQSDDFKLNCNLVFIDFFVRHGIIGPNDPEYLALVTGLHGQDKAETG